MYYKFNSFKNEMLNYFDLFFVVFVAVEQYEPEWAEKAYRMGKYFYECGKYMQSISYLYFCSLVMQPTDKNYLNVLWGILAAEILQLNWNSALESMNRLRDYIDNSNFRWVFFFNTMSEPVSFFSSNPTRFLT